MGGSSDDQTTSTSYPFYVELDSSDGLMLGQHVYIERDIGQDEQKDGLWISDYYIVDADTNEPYVWAANDKKKLEKRYVTLGKHDDDLEEYEIVDGLTALHFLLMRFRKARPRKKEILHRPLAGMILLVQIILMDMIWMVLMEWMDMTA